MSEESSSNDSSRVSKLSITYLLNDACKLRDGSCTIVDEEDNREPWHIAVSSSTHASTVISPTPSCTCQVTRDIQDHSDGTVHISLRTGELVRRGPLATNLQQRRRTLALRGVDLRRTCCKRMRCFETADRAKLAACVRETLLMGQKERRARLAGWLTDGVFWYGGKRVCSAFLASAFGFSRDLQRSVKKESLCKEGEVE